MRGFVPRAYFIARDNIPMARNSMAFDAPEELPLPRSQTAAMQLALQLIAAGYRWVHYGEVNPAKVQTMVARMMERHFIHLPSEAQSVRRRAGLPVARLILAPYPEELENYADKTKRRVWPYLLVATGELDGEPLKPVQPPPKKFAGADYRLRHKRADRDGETFLAYTWRGRYVLGWVPKTGGKKGENPWRLTWFLTDWEFDRWSGSLILAARHGDVRALTAAFKYLANYPRFAGIRRDLKRLIKATKKAFDPHRRQAKPHKLRFPLPEELDKLKPITRVKVWDKPPLTLGKALENL